MKCRVTWVVVVFVTSIALMSCKPNSAEAIKFRQYFLKGEQLYLQHCSNCHQKDGSGLALLYPPLNSADFMIQYPDSVICIIKNGRSGLMLVNGKSFNQPMPAFPQLTDIEVAQLATFIHNSWSNKRGIIEVKDVSQKLEECSRR